MEQVLLINIEDIRAFKPLSFNVDSATKVEPFILEAQIFDLKAFLGDELYIDLLEKKSSNPQFETEAYKNLFNGCTYTHGERTYIHQGLKAVLCYYAYARILPNLNVTSTAFGLVEKLNNDSKSVDSRILERQVNQALSSAQYHQGDVYDFLCRKKSDYPKWYGSSKKQSTGGIKISSVGGKRYEKVGSSRECSICGRYNCNH